MLLAAIGAPLTAQLLQGGTVTVDELLRRRPFLIAHRGGSANWPEMSLHAYEQSAAHGIPALEMSVGRSSDGVWFGLHDATLDRTSGTVGFTAGDHPWAEISRYRIHPPPTAPHQPARPYLRLTDFLARFAASHVLFLDPKSQNRRFYPELLDLLRSSVADPMKHVIAKGPAASLVWPRFAADAGYRRWGFYYARELSRDPTLLARTQGAWDLLGLDYGASSADWKAVTSYGKPVVGHVISRKIDERRALSEGAAGIMLADVLRLSPASPGPWQATSA